MNPSILNISFFVLGIMLISGTIFFYLLRKSRKTATDDTYWISRNDRPIIPSAKSTGEVTRDYESNVPGIFLAGELSGSQTINEAVQHGNEAVEQISQSFVRQYKADYDLIIVGAGPAGISAALTAKNKDMRFLLLEQETLTGAVLSHSEESISLSAPLNIPLEGEVTLKKSSKDGLISLWHHLILKYHIPLQEYSRVESIITLNGYFTVISSDGQNFTSANVLIATGLWTNSGRLNIPGENRGKVAFALNVPAKITGKNILVVGGNDEAIEAAITLSHNNKVTLSYKKEKLNNIKPLDSRLIGELFRTDRLQILLKTNLLIIDEDHVILYSETENIKLPNDLVYIFNDTESTRNFLEKCGVRLSALKEEKVLSSPV